MFSKNPAKEEVALEHSAEIKGTLRLDPSSPVPLYQQLVVLLRHRIESGALAPGDRMEGEKDLCALYGVSRITARRALDELALSGLVDRQRGRGTRVRERDTAPEPAPLVASIEGLLENVGQIGRSTSVRVLDRRIVPAPRDIAGRLDVAPGEPLQHAVRVRSLGGVPMSFLETWVPEGVAALINGSQETPVPLLLLLEEAGVPVASARQSITATLADARVAAELDLAAGAPLIEVGRTVYDRDGRAVEHVRVLYRPDLYRLEVSMERVETRDGLAWRAEPGA